VRHLLAIAALLPAAALAAGGVVGPETCKACHPAAYASWREGPHARAQDSLGERGRLNRRCLSCHSPAAEAGLAGVGCEACHGPGHAYAAGYVMRDAELARALGLLIPGERSCAACHTEATPSLQRFDFAKKVRLIAHPEPRAGEASPASRPAAPPPR